MTSALKIAGLFAGFFIFLSISVKNAPIFDHIYSVTSNVTVPTQELAMSLFSKAANSTTAYTKKLFDNSVPKHRDSVKAKMAAPVRSTAAAQETILTDEKEELDDLIKNHR